VSEHVTELGKKARRHVGCMLNANKDGLNAEMWHFLRRGYSHTVCTIPRTTVCRHRPTCHPTWV